MDKNPRTVNQINVDLRANNSKTIHCMQYKYGKCSYGQNCRYAHVYGNSSNVSKYSADEYRIRYDNVCIGPKCWKFWNGDFCPYGKNCRFLHDEPTATKTGYWKTRLCYTWVATGRCPHGKLCFCAHGENEQRGSHSQIDVLQEVISNSRKRSATAALHVPCYETVNVSARDLDKKRNVFISNKKLKGIYADWIDEIPIVENFELNLY